MFIIFDVLNKVFTQLKNAVREACPNAGTSSIGSQSAFPYLAVETITNETTADDMENSENAVHSVIQVSSFSNKNMTEARSIAALAADAMLEMGYRRTGPFTPENIADTNIYRVIYRYSRVIGVGEEL